MLSLVALTTTSSYVEVIDRADIYLSSAPACLLKFCISIVESSRFIFLAEPMSTSKSIA